MVSACYAGAMTFQAKLEAAAARNGSLLCIGLDSDPLRMPVADSAAFNRAIIEATADLVCAYKPNAAFYEAQGLDGWRALQDTMQAVPPDIPVILDAKRGDVPSTARAYATACFDVLGADAVTVNPYLGADAVQPFLERPDRTALVLCRTSNPGAPTIQDLAVEGEPLYLKVAALVDAWSRPHRNAGLVVGATYPAELVTVRQRCPDLPILLPGIGAQSGALEAAVAAGVDAGGGGLIVSASRSVLYALTDTSAALDRFAAAARAAAKRLRAAINAARPGTAPAQRISTQA